MEKKIWIRLPDSVKTHLGAIRDLASKGLNKQHISRQLGVTINAFSKYREVSDAFKDGRSDLAVKVSSAFEANIGVSYSDRVHLSKALRLFSGSYHLEPITDMKSAQSAMSTSLLAFAEGSISADDLETVRKSLSTYVDSVSSTVLEERLQTIEDQLSGKVEAM